MVIIQVRMKVVPSKRTELLQTIQSLITKMRQEDGCLDISFFQGTEDENTFLLLEQWSASESAETHLRAETFTIIRGAGSVMCDSLAVNMSHLLPLSL